MEYKNGDGPYKKKAFERQSRSGTHSVLEQLVVVLTFNPGTLRQRQVDFCSRLACSWSARAMW